MTDSQLDCNNSSWTRISHKNRTFMWVRIQCCSFALTTSSDSKSISRIRHWVIWCMISISCLTLCNFCVKYYWLGMGRPSRTSCISAQPTTPKSISNTSINVHCSTMVTNLSAACLRNFTKTTIPPSGKIRTKFAEVVVQGYITIDK